MKKCFATSFRDKEAAIQAAHRDRDLKQAVQDGNVEAVKQISEWAEMKFGKKDGEG